MKKNQDNIYSGKGSVRVGSVNPVKLAAVREVLSQSRLFECAVFVPVSASSGVSDQPMGLEETLLGARNRAEDAFSGSGLGVGLEAGIIPVPLTRTGFMNITACAMFNGKEYFLGLGPAFELPENVTRRVVEEAMELDNAVLAEGMTVDKRIGYSQGLIGLMTGGRVTRMEYSMPAVSMALSGLEKSRWVGKPVG